MTFKPTEIETPKSESFSGPSEPGNGAPPPREPDPPEKSLFQPVEIETPESESFSGPSAPGTGQPGDGLDSNSGYGIDDGARPVVQKPAPLPQADRGGRPGDGVSSNRGYILTCDVPLSDLPGKYRGAFFCA